MCEKASELECKDHKENLTFLKKTILEDTIPHINNELINVKNRKIIIN